MTNFNCTFYIQQLNCDRTQSEFHDRSQFPSAPIINSLFEKMWITLRYYKTFISHGDLKNVLAKNETVLFISLSNLSANFFSSSRSRIQHVCYRPSNACKIITKTSGNIFYVLWTRVSRLKRVLPHLICLSILDFSSNLGIIGLKWSFGTD